MFGLDSSLFWWLRGLVFLFTWREKSGFSKAHDADMFTNTEPDVTKTMVFIRHGESDWNEVFNKEKYLLLPRLFFGLLREFTKCFQSQDSVFLDSPLSAEGCDQAEELRKFLFNTKNDKTKNISVRVAQQDTPEQSKLVCSNLRRGVHTGLIGLFPRLERNTGEKILLLAELQEMSRNVDTESITNQGEVPVVEVVDRCIGQPSAQWLDASKNTGNKAICKSALPRFNAFCEWACQQKQETVVVAAGHSLWFKEFFKLYLPQKSTHKSKKDKMLNCASVSFTLCQAKDGQGVNTGWYIKEQTIAEDYLGFKKSSKKSLKKKIGMFVGLSMFIGLIAVLFQYQYVSMTGVCTTGVYALRGGSVVFLVASLVAAGMYTCAGKSLGKLMAISFYAFIFYMLAIYAPTWCGSSETIVAAAVDATVVVADVVEAAAETIAEVVTEL